jgi:hypothetical protein
VILYANGDSHSYGAGVDPKEKFVTLIAEKLNLSLINQAVVGSSNQKIIRTTQDYLKNNNPDFILIGWSTWEREEWFYNEKYYDVNSSGHDVLPKELQEKYKVWVTEQTSDTVDIKSQHWHQEIYKLHLELMEKNIPHVFFNCMYNFFHITEELDWGHNYIGPYDNKLSYYWYLKNQGYIPDSWYHYGADGHSAWGKFLIEYIKKYDLIR